MEDPVPAQPPNSKKRPADGTTQIQNCEYYKMRAIVRDLRPHFIEVLRTPDFVDCKAAHAIREKIEVLMDLYKVMTPGTTGSENGKNAAETRPLPGEAQDGQMPGEKHHPDVVMATERPPPDKVSSKPPSEDKSVLMGTISNKQQLGEDGRNLGTYVVGGSAFGWNFITYPGHKAVYCGRTKESFRLANRTAMATATGVMETAMATTAAATPATSQ